MHLYLYTYVYVALLLIIIAIFIKNVENNKFITMHKLAIIYSNAENNNNS